MVKVHEKTASGGQGMIPWTPGCESSHPSFLGVRAFAEIFMKSIKACLSNFSKVWPPAGPPEAFLNRYV